MVRRSFRLLVIVVITVSQTGCMTALLVGDMTRTETKTTSRVVAEDDVYAIGRIETPEILKQSPDALALLGKNGTYVILQGGDALKAMAQNLDGTLLAYSDPSGQAFRPNQPLSFELSKDGQFRRWTYFIYRKTVANLSPVELATINKIDPRPNAKGGYFYFRVDISGYVSTAPVTIKGDPAQFKLSRKIVFQETKSENVINPKKILNLLALPATVVIDVVTLPIQAIFFSKLAAEHDKHWPAPAEQK